MWQNITSVVASICVSGTLMQPAGANGQTFSLDSESAVIEGVLTPASGPTKTTGIVRDSASTIREWQWRPGTTVQARTQIRAPRRPARQPTQHSGAYRDTQRVLAAFALGFVGFYAGAITAYGFAENCGCGNSATVFLGGGIGAAAGATAAMLLVR